VLTPSAPAPARCGRSPPHARPSRAQGATCRDSPAGALPPIAGPPQAVRLPRILGSQITVRGYPLAMVYAEKIVTTIVRGTTSRRWRDFADLYLLARHHPIYGADLAASIQHVADHRGTRLALLAQALDGYGAIGHQRWEAWRILALPALAGSTKMILRGAHSASLGLARSAYARPTTRSVASMRPPTSSERVRTPRCIRCCPTGVSRHDCRTPIAPSGAPFETQPIAVAEAWRLRSSNQNWLLCALPGAKVGPLPLPGEGLETDETELHRSAASRPGRGSSRAMRFAVVQYGLPTAVKHVSSPLPGAAPAEAQEHAGPADG